jgi:hypothetical protein
MANWARKKAAGERISRARASKFEETFEKTLVAAGIQYAYEAIKVKFTPPAKERTKTWDWLITTDSGKTFIVETKGWWPPRNRLDETEAIHQNTADVRYCFQRASTPIRKNSKTTYGDWCSKNGILWCEGTIPLSWLSE